MRLPTSFDAGKSGPEKERTERPSASPPLTHGAYDPLLVRRLHKAHAYRSSLLRDLWRMRRNPYQWQGVADRRRELVLTRERIARLIGMMVAAVMAPESTTVGEKPMVAEASVGQETGRPAAEEKSAIRPAVVVFCTATVMFCTTVDRHVAAIMRNIAPARTGAGGGKAVARA